ncbi:hypothetical protein [Pseudonocardia xishanensis]|uniref:Uncharacterized protein n=1 Tax=Pseudonocardia xishanensis TaxID=630995 RepID=A0ABP8RZ33_9PSEU
MAEAVESGKVAPEEAADGLGDVLTALSAVNDPSDRSGTPRRRTAFGGPGHGMPLVAGEES